MASTGLHKKLPPELEAELGALFDAAVPPKHMKHNLTQAQRTQLESDWPILKQHSRLLGLWWKSKSVARSRAWLRERCV